MTSSPSDQKGASNSTKTFPARPNPILSIASTFAGDSGGSNIDL